MIPALLLALIGLTDASALPKDKIIQHVRETFAIPGNVPMELGEPKASSVKGLDVATLKIGAGEQLQSRDLYVTQDGHHYFMAEAMDIRKDPDGERRKQLDLAGNPSKGPADAKVTIVEFSDFQCPFCQQAHQSLEQSLKAYEGKVRLVFKHFPLERIHPWAFQAAVASLCAAKQKETAFWTFADAYFAGQKEITKETLKARSNELAKKAGLDLGRFETCYDKQETSEKVRKDFENGDQMGVGSTPTFYVNGHPVRGYAGFEPFKQLIDEMLAGKHP